MATQKLSALRAWMHKEKIDAFIVPHADRFQSEYLPPRDERLAWLTGFTGSNGLAIVTTKQAALFTDSRYTLQAGKQVNKKDYAIVDMAAQHPTQWLDARLKPRLRVAVDPWLFTVNQFAQWGKIIQANAAMLVTLQTNPIDTLWRDRPAASTAKATSHALKYAGITTKQKIKQLISGRRCGAHSGRRSIAGLLAVEYPWRRCRACAGAAVAGAGHAWRQGDVVRQSGAGAKNLGPLGATFG